MDHHNVTVNVFLCAQFNSFVSLSHDTCRQKTEALLRYHLYVDCMPPDGMEELNKESVKRMLDVARSSPRLKEPR